MLRSAALLIFALVMTVALVSVPVDADIFNEQEGTCLIDFEDEGILDPPSSESPCHNGMSVSGSGSSFVTDTVAHGGAKSWKLAVGASASWLSLIKGIDDTTSVDYWFYPQFSTGTGEVYIGYGNPNGAQGGCTIDREFIGVRLQSNGDLDAALCTNVGAGDQFVNLGTVTYNDWNHVGIRDYDGATGQVRIISQTIGNSVNIDSVGVVTNNPSKFGKFASGGVEESGTIYMDDILMSGVSVVVPPVGAAASVAVAGIQGFDVDSSGTSVITRLDDGSVEVYGGQSLGTINSVATTCLQTDGVAAIETHVTYADCDGGGVVTHLRIRSNNLGPASPPGACESFVGDVPVSDLEDDDVEGDIVINDVRELRSVDSFLFDFSNCDTSFTNEASIVWAFSTFTGRVGAAGVLFTNNLGGDNTPDDGKVASKQFDPTASPNVNQLCSWTSPNGEKLIAAGTANGNTKAYRVDVDAAGPSQTISVSISQVLSLSGAFGNAVGLACAGDFLFIETADAVRMVNRNTGAQVWTAPATPPATGRGVAMSGDAKWVFWYDGGSVIAAHAGNGTVVGEIETPSGTWFQIEAEGLGQNAWIATSTGISRFETWTITTGTPIGSSDPDAGTGTPTGVAGTVAGSNAGWGDFLGSAAAGTVVSALIAVFGFMGVGATVGEERNGKVNGAMAGLGMAAGLAAGIWFSLEIGWLTVTQVFIVSLLFALVTVGWFFFGRGS